MMWQQTSPQTKHTWTVHKFGGTSVKDAECYRKVASILRNERALSPGLRQGVVVSAMAGITDALLELVTKAKQRDNDYLAFMSTSIVERHLHCINALLPDHDQLRNSLISVIERDSSNIEHILRSIYMTGSSSVYFEELISGHGEVWSAQILCALIQSENTCSCSWLDARQVLFVSPNPHQPSGTPDINWELSHSKIDAWFMNNLVPRKTASSMLPLLPQPGASPIPMEVVDCVVVTGYVATNANGLPTTLKRNGSDYSGSIFGALLHASQITIWTDVDGVYSADPRKVPDAVLIPEMSYTEASELSFYGAKIIHPKTMLPAVKLQVPVWIRNTFNPTCAGTKIHSRSGADVRESSREQLNGVTSPPPWDVIMGFCTIDNLSLIVVVGAAIGAREYAPLSTTQRLLKSLCSVNIPLVLTAQAAPEHSIAFCVPKHQGEAALRAIKQDFADDFAKGHIASIQLLSDYTILTGVGDRISRTAGVAARFFSALERANVNVLGVAQNGDRVLCVVVESKNAVQGLRALHDTFKIPQRSVSLGLIGTGRIAMDLLRVLCPGNSNLSSTREFDLNIRCMINQHHMFLSDHIAEDTWMKASGNGQLLEESNWDKFMKHFTASQARHRIIIDCSGSTQTAAMYRDWMKEGIHILTCNKHTGAEDPSFFNILQRQLRTRSSHRAHCFYGPALGGGIPLAQALSTISAVDDELLEIEGVLSGTWSHILTTLTPASGPATEPVKFSSAIADCFSLGLLEDDPRDDLTGTDNARVLSLMTRLAIPFDPVLPSNVRIEMPFIDPLPECSTLADLLKVCSVYDSLFAHLQAEAEQAGEVLRLVTTWSRQDGGRIAIRRLPRSHPFAQIPASATSCLIKSVNNPEGVLLVGSCGGTNILVDDMYSDLLRLVRLAFSNAQVGRFQSAKGAISSFAG